MSVGDPPPGATLDGSQIAPLPARDDELDGLAVREADRYAVTVEHARGGLGRVLRAEDRRLGRTVAIKELLEQRGDEATARFVREALITARLQHPGIVPVYDAGRWPDGEPYYAMKLVSGGSLRDAVAACPGLDERLALVPRVLAVCETMAYAHHEGVIHRDLKPSNVVLGPYGETVVVDWGLAKDLRAGDADAGGAASSERRSLGMQIGVE